MSSKRFFVILFLFLHGFQQVNSQTYYVSSSQGSNVNDGLTPQTPKKDLCDVPKEGVSILLKRGDVFWGNMSGYTNCTISSYGFGDRPVICGFKVLVNPDAWKFEGNQLWSLDLRNTTDFRGAIEKEPSNTINNIGFIYDPLHNRVFGRNLRSTDLLTQEMDFYTSSYFTTQDIKEHPFGTVIVKSTKNPAEMGCLCFPIAANGLSDMRNCRIQGLAIVGFSRNGIIHIQNCTVENCQIDLIGGGIFTGFQYWVRAGNGVELWYTYCDNTITNCIISRTFDCATTIQANGVIRSNPRNNRFVGNRIYKCRQAFEHFLNPSDNTLWQYDNCEFSNNICYLMGDNEFDSPELRDCNILSYENDPKEVIIRNNTFFGGNHLDGSGFSGGMNGNIIFIYEDQYLYTRHWGKDSPLITCENDDAIFLYREAIEDNSDIVVLKRGSLKARIIEWRIRRRVNWKPIRLHFEKWL